MSGILVGRYEYVEQLGVGGFGVVDHYRDLITGDNVAIKTIPASCIHRESKRLIREVDILCFLYNAHPHVVGYFNMFVTRSNDDDGSGKASSRGGGVLDANGVYTLPASDVPADLYVLGPQYASLSTHEKLVRHHERLRAHVTQLQRGVPFHLHIVMPLMKGDLLNFIGLVAPGSRARSTQGLTREFVAQVSVVFAFQICFGLDYLHKSHILHRDMKPDNVLVRLDVSNPYMSSALITDLGLARDAHESDTFYICTRYYRPPEMITNSSKGSPAVDVWSLGCIFYEMCTSKVLLSLKSALRDGMWDGGKASNQLEEVLNTLGTPTHADIHRYMPDGNAKLYLLRSVPRESQLPQLIRQHWQLAVSAEEQRLWIDLITRCLAFFPQQRPTAEQLCCHALFRRYRILYGENVKQYEARKYTPTYADAALSNSLQAENKAMVLELVRHALMQTMPDPDEDASDVSGDSDAEAAAAASDADSSEREEKDEDEFDDNHDDRNSNVSDDSSDANDYDLHNHHHHHDNNNNGNNNRHVASGAHPPHAYMRSTAAAIAEALPPLRTHDAQQQQQQQQQRRQHAAAHKTHDEDDDEDDDGGGGYHVVARSDSDSDSDDDIGLAVRRAAAAVETDSDDAHGGSDDGDDGAATRITAAAAAAARPHAQTTTAMTTRRVSSPHNGYASAPSGSGHGGGGGPLGGVYGQPNDLCMSSLLMQPLLQQRQQHVLQRADHNKSTHSNNGNNNGKSEDDEDASSDDADHTTAATATTRTAASAEQQRMRPQLRFLHSFTAQVRTPETSQPFAEPTGLQHMRSNSNSSSSSSSTSSDNSDNDSDSDEDNDDNNNRHNNDDDDDDDAASDNDNSSDDGLRSSIAGLAVSRSEAQPMMSFYPSLYAHSHDDGKQSALGYHDNGSSSNNSSGGVGGGGDATAALYSPAYLSPLQSKMTQSQQPSALYHTQPLHRGGASSSATTATAMQQPSFTTMYAANNNNGHGDGSLTAQAASSSPARMQQQQQQRGGAMSYGVASGKGSSHPHASASAASSGGAAAAAAKDSSFPTHLDEALRERYSKFGRSEADVQRAIGQLLGDMEDCRRDAARSRQLRELLRYFNTLQSSEPTDVGRESSGYVYS